MNKLEHKRWCETRRQMGYHGPKDRCTSRLIDGKCSDREPGFEPYYCPKYDPHLVDLSELTIAAVVEGAFKNAESKGFWPSITPACIPEKIALIHSEVSEVLEEFRNGHDPQEVYFDAEKPDKPEGIPAELADVVIRVADLCGALGIDLDSAIQQKMAYNQTRPHKHGGKVI